jgi:hypothetical protein
MRAVLGLALMVALGCRHGTSLGTIQDAAAADVAASETALDAAPDASPAGAVCPSAHADPRELALATLSADQIIYVRADGSRSVVHRFGDGAQEQRLSRRGPYLVASARLPEGGGAFLEVALLDHAGALRWRYSGAAPGPRINWDVLVADDGAAVLGIEDRALSAIAIAPDGSTRSLGDVYPVAPPAAGGGLLVRRGPVVPDTTRFGFVDPGASTMRPLSLPLARHAASGPVVRGDRFVYLGSDQGRVVLVDERLDGSDRFPLAVEDDGSARLVEAGARFLVTMAEVPRWLWRPQGGPPVALTGIDITAPATYLTPRWALVMTGKRPGWLIDLDSAQVHALTPPAGLPSPAGDLTVTGAGSWFLGADDARPIWRLEAPTGAFTSIDLSPLLPLRPYPAASYCNGTSVLEDGRVVTTLRNDWMAALFVGAPGTAPWTQIGRAVTGDGALQGEPIGASWLVWFQVIKETFCPPQSSGPWQMPPAGATPPLSRSALQLVPASGEPLVLPPYRSLNFDQTGSCAEIDRVIYDFKAGIATSLGIGSIVVWP